MEIRDYVQMMKKQLEERVSQCKRPPSFVIIQVNDDPASEAYIRGKMKDSEEVGMLCRLVKLPITTSEEELLLQIEKENQNPEVDGLIVQMPLPKGISEEKVKLAVCPEKDIDGFHPCSKFAPCTPKGVIDYLRYEGLEFLGKNAVVIGRSHIVGRPLAKMLIDLDTNCTVLHSKTKEEDKKRYIKNADFIFTAVGKKDSLSLDYEYKADACVVDIGITRVEGKLYGDASMNLPVRLQTPVPGGVGLLTRLTLLMNLMEAYENGIQH